MAPSKTAWVLRGIDRSRQHGEHLAALEGGAELLLGGALGEYQHDGARGARARRRRRRRARWCTARASMTSTWRALAAAEALERGLDGVDRAHRGLAVERLAEFQQEVIARGDRGDVDRRLGTLAFPVVEFGSLGTAGGSRWCTGHVASPTRAVNSAAANSPFAQRGCTRRLSLLPARAKSRRCRICSLARQRSASVHNNDRPRRGSATRLTNL